MFGIQKTISMIFSLKFISGHFGANVSFILHSRRNVYNGLLWIAFYRLFQKETHYSSVKNTINQYIANGILFIGCHLVFLDWINATKNLSIIDLLTFLITLDTVGI